MSGADLAALVARVEAGETPVVVGPTASGKSALALRLAEALGGEIVNADSVQIVRGFDVGSGKPTAEARAGVPHHLYDAVGPMDAIDAGAYADRALATLAEIRARGRVPVVCGGTFLWVRALVWGLAKMPAADADVRARHAALAEAEGRPALHARLAAVDPESAARLSPNDLVRVSRALEVWELSGRPLSAFHAEHGFREPRLRARFLGVARAPDELSARISARTRAFLAAGWVAEVEGLLAAGFRDARAMGSVGYREVRDFVDGALAARDLPDAIDRATRTFVRRQRTWLRAQPVTWLPPAALG